MMNYVKLVNFEFNRVAKLFAVLLGITLVLQMIGVVVESRRYLSMANDQMYEQMLTSAQFLASYGQMSFIQVVRSTWFMGPIALCVAGVGFYIFLIWYRDWVGKNTFIYRLLMLPTSRLNIFFSKITTILILTVGLVAFQLILLPIEMWIMKLMVPTEFRSDINVLQILNSMPELSIIIPSNFLELILFYGAGLMGVSILFTAILLERSFKWKGIFAGVLYGGASIIVLILPILLHEFVFNQFFYPVELFVLVVLMGVIVFAASVWLSGFLLRKKITV